jgi:hypothetical protein
MNSPTRTLTIVAVGAAILAGVSYCARPPKSQEPFWTPTSFVTSTSFLTTPTIGATLSPTGTPYAPATMVHPTLAIPYAPAVTVTPIPTATSRATVIPSPMVGRG